MDTRTKIAGLEEALALLAGKSARVVTGFFDPLTGADAARLEGLAPGGGSLVVVVSNPERPLLPSRARAELVAALRVVGLVVEAEDARAAAARFAQAGAEVIEREREDARSRRELMRHVHDRQSAT